MNRFAQRTALAALAGAALSTAPALAQDVNWAEFDFGVPLQQPFVCENDAHGLGEARDEWCQTEAIVDYVYFNTEGEWAPFDPQATRPTDIAETDVNDVVVPMIARREIGKTANGSTYVVGMLHDPASGDAPTPQNRSPGWNGKLIIGYGGGVEANYHSGRGCGMDDELAYLGDGTGQGYQNIFMERGYATLCGSLMVMGTNNDDVKSAETTAQAKARFVELYGEPEFTISVGASGGSMQQLLVANNYPGLLDGIMPKRDYPDGITFLEPLHDCELLVQAFEDSDLHWSEQQRTAVSGYATFDYCVRNGARYPNLRPDNCDAVVIDAVTNDDELTGVRCTYADNLRYVYGVEEYPDALDAIGSPAGVAARSVYDNVGVQYGLRALNGGDITFEQFVNLNQGVGGFDINGAIRDERSVASEEVVRIAYETGRIAAGKPLADIPIIDVRRWRDVPQALANPTNIDVHDASHSRAVRERLIAANGDAGNHVIITAADSTNRAAGTPIAVALNRALAQMDEWLTNIKADTRDIPQHDKVVANKPEDLVDSCYPTAERKLADWELCQRMFPYAGHPRIAAGGPLTEDVLKCALKPVDAADYEVDLTAEQLAQLEETFPEGVCDWSQPGIGQVAQIGTWLSFDGDGGYTVGQPL